MGNKIRFKKPLALLLAAAMTLTTLSADAVALRVNAGEAQISVTACKGYEEGAYATWSKVECADGYAVFVSQDPSNDNSWVQLDDELIRNYGSYMRADALGLKPGTWHIKIVASTYNSAKEPLATVAQETKTVTVTAHDRSGYAWSTDDGFDASRTPLGAYNGDGSLKSDAHVIYLTEANKDKVKLTVTTRSGDNTVEKECTGIQNILSAYQFGLDTTPLDIRVIGMVTDPSVLVSGDLSIQNARNGAGGITIEGVGEDAVIRGFGFALSNANNVEIRNLAFMLCDSKEGDNVSLVDHNDHIWVHHCDFFYGEEGSDPEGDQAKGDGMLDCKLSNYVTFSYNHFWDSGKCCLLGLIGEDDTYFITYHHNWFDHSDSRHPRVRSYNAHVYNNYYDGNSKYGIGAALGASVFAENNYFRNVNRPMIISGQGSDGGTMSNENGGMIKAYGNYMKGQAKFVPYAAAGAENNGTATSGDGSDMRGDSAEFDAYVVKARSEQVPATVTAKKGEAKYSNFDVRGDFYPYTVTPVKDVPAVVTENAGRLNGGDFVYSFDYEGADASHDVDTVLKTKLTQYRSSLVSVGGILNASDKSYVTVTFDTANGGADSIEPKTVELNQPVEQPADPTHIPEGFVAFGYWMNGSEKWDFADPVTGDMTLTAKWFTQAELDAVTKGGTPIGSDPVEFTLVTNNVLPTYGNPWFEISGDPKKESGTSATYERYNGTNGNHRVSGNYRLTFEGSAYIKFTTTAETSMLALLLDITQTSNRVNVDGKPVKATDGVVLADLPAGEHILTPKDGSYVFAIMVFPGETVPVIDPGFEENPDNMELNVSEDLEVKTYNTDETVKGFTLKAASGSMTVDANGKTIDGRSFTKRLKTGGAGDTTKRSVSFAARKGATIYFAAMAGNKETTVNVTVSHLDAENKEVKDDTVQMGGTSISSHTTTATEDGTYYIYADGGTSIYYISVTYPNLYKVTFEANGGSAVETAKVPGGTCLTKPADPEKTDFVFAGWYSDEALTTRFDFTTSVIKPLTLYAKWVDAATRYTVTFESRGGSAVSAQEVLIGQTAAEPVPAPTKQNAEFLGWYTDEACESAYDFNTPVLDHITLYAAWNDSVTVTFDTDGGSEVAAQTLTPGTAATEPVPAPTKQDYAFKGWFVSAEKKVLYDFATPVTESITLFAKWNPIHTVTFKVMEGAVAPEPQRVERGGLIDIPSAPEVEGYRFEGWYIDEGCTERFDFSKRVIKDTIIYSKWKFIPKGLYVEFEEPEAEYVYTGSAFTPAITVTNNGEPLTEGVDYTVKYTNNVNASVESTKKPTVTVTGKGNLNGKTTVSFEIKPRPLTDEDVYCGNIAITEKDKNANKSITPVISYNGVLLKSKKDFDGCEVVWGKDGTGTYTVTGKGNYTGTATGDIAVKEAAQIKKFTVTVAAKNKDGKPWTYNGDAIEPEVTVKDAATKATLESYVDGEEAYTIIYSNNVNAGTAYVTVVGVGQYSGIVTRKFTIKPSAASDKLDINDYVVQHTEYEYRPSGAVIDDTDLTITSFFPDSGSAQQLLPGKDYTIKYSNNKRVGTGQYTVNFIGNYKGTKAVKGTFAIIPTRLDLLQYEDTRFKLLVGDKVYNGKPGTYVSAPYVSLDGVMLTKKDYTITYYSDEDHENVIDKKHPLTGPGKVYAVIAGKGNYSDDEDHVIECEYNVCSAEGATDLSKAKITVVTKKAEYTGEEVRPQIEVTIGSGKKAVPVPADQYTVEYICNIHKGKGTILINGNGGSYCGSKTQTFAIVSKNIGISSK